MKMCMSTKCSAASVDSNLLILSRFRFVTKVDTKLPTSVMTRLVPRRHLRVPRQGLGANFSDLVYSPEKGRTRHEQ
jgi:hypothetical protein